MMLSNPASLAQGGTHSSSCITDALAANSEPSRLLPCVKEGPWTSANALSKQWLIK